MTTQIRERSSRSKCLLTGDLHGELKPGQRIRLSALGKKLRFFVAVSLAGPVHDKGWRAPGPATAGRSPPEMAYLD